MATDRDDDPAYNVPVGDGSVAASPIPVTYELADGTVFQPKIDPLFGPQTQRRVDVHPSKQASTVIEKATDKDIARSLEANRTCNRCRYFDLRRGQEKFAKEKLETALRTELQWKSGWYDPSQYGLCHLDPRTATHQFATCAYFKPNTTILSFLGKRSAR